MSATETIAAAAKEGGLLTERQVEIIADGDRLHVLLVRCKTCRFMAPTQNIKHLIAYVNAGGDYVRDVSLPAGDSAYNR